MPYPDGKAPFHLEYHVEYPSGLLKIEAVRGDVRRRIATPWAGEQGDTVLGELVFIMGCEARQIDPCEECRARKAKFEADYADLQARRRRGEAPPATADPPKASPLPERKATPATASSADDAPA